MLVAVLALAATAGESEASRQKKRRRKKHREQAEATAASSESPRPPTTPESKRESTVPVAPETLTSAAMAAAAVGESPRPPANSESSSLSEVPVAPETPTSAVTVAAAAASLVKERERKNHVSPPASPLIEDPVRKEEKKRKKRKHGEAAMVIPPPPTPAATQNLQMESKVTAEGATARKKQRRQKVEQEQSGHPPFPIDVHPQGRQEAADGGGVMGSQCVKRSSSKKPRVLKKQQPLPQGFSPPVAGPNSIDQDPNYSSPYGAFARFVYKPDRRRDGNGPPLPNTVDRPVKLPPQGHPSSGSSLLTAKETSKAARTTTSNTKQPCPASASTHGSQEEARIKGKEKPENKMTREMAVRESPHPLANPEYKSDSAVLVTQKILSSAEILPVAVRQVKERERKNQEALPPFPLMEEPAWEEEKKRKKRKHGEAAVVIPPPPTTAATQNLQMESKVMAEGATARKKQRRQKVEQEQSGHPPFPIDVHPQGRQEAADGGGVMGSPCVKRSSSMKPRVLKKQQPLPQGFSPPVAGPNSIDQDPNYSSPYGAFARFVYKPDQRRDGNGPPLPNTVDRPVKLPPQGHPSSGSSLLTAKETSKAARTTTSNTKQPCPASASTHGSQEEARIKGKEKPENKMTREMAVRESPHPLANPEYKSDSAVLVTQKILSSAEILPVAVRQVKERERKNQEALPPFPLMEEPAWEEFHRRPLILREKKHKKRKNGEAAVMIPSPPTDSVTQILQMESKVMAEGATVRKKHRRRKVEHEQSGQPPYPIDVHPQAGAEAAAAGGVVGSQCVKRSSSKKSQVLKKQQPLPQGFFPPMANPNSIDQDCNYSSPFGAFFAQFAYKPDHRQDGNGPPLPNTTDRPARLPPRGHPSSGSSLLTAKQTSKAARATSNTKQPCPASASTSGSHEGVRIKRKKKPEKEMTGEKKPRKKSPALSASEKRSDKYRRLPLDKLVSPPRSPHKLLQEKYASDPWKVIVICMLLNLTQGKQVRKKVKGFFKRYPDPQTAYTADPEKMAEYLAPLGLQRVKAKRIQKFSKAYVGEEWTYITELCGVGKYAADAYAIFCAGRANEVIPQDHKLVDYWEFVCPELSAIKDGGSSYLLKCYSLHSKLNRRMRRRLE